MLSSSIQQFKWINLNKTSSSKKKKIKIFCTLLDVIKFKLQIAWDSFALWVNSSKRLYTREKNTVVLYYYIFSPYDGMKNYEYKMCVQALYVCASLSVVVCMCATLGEDAQQDISGAWISARQIKFECKCSGISWQSVIKTLLCLMICFVNVVEQRVVCNSGGHLQKSVYPLAGGFEQQRCTYCMCVHNFVCDCLWVSKVCSIATFLIMERHLKAKAHPQAWTP